jgi:hypothetical protein
MIDQWTDGLIRGLWITPYYRISTNTTIDIFRPAPPSTLLLGWDVRQVGSLVPPSECIWQTYMSRWSPSQIMHKHVIWTLTTTLAHQTFCTAAMAWVKAPWYSSRIILVTHLMQNYFGRTNKNILLVGHFWKLPLPADFEPLVPFLIFYLPPFVRSLPTSTIRDLDEPTYVPYHKWVRAQTDLLRGV